MDALRVGEVHRAQKTLMAAGGKGLNVARTIYALGGSPFCMGLLGGHTGNLLAELAEREGLSAYWTRMKSETRTCVILVENDKDATVINERGAGVCADECQNFLRDVWTQADHAERVCISGSLPLGFSLDDFLSCCRGWWHAGIHSAVWHLGFVCIRKTAGNLTPRFDNSNQQSYLPFGNHCRSGFDGADSNVLANQVWHLRYEIKLGT
ncbi:MAG: hypothetical protein IPL71_03590 [Anaerolineales bacterium]|nr:hypothetical protein [Anaerolineales bacterium]